MAHPEWSAAGWVCHALFLEWPLLAEQGILWLVTIVPAILLLLGWFVIRQYELSDEKMDEINREIAERGK